jgi:hypothetical protein
VCAMYAQLQAKTISARVLALSEERSERPSLVLRKAQSGKPQAENARRRS